METHFNSYTITDSKKRIDLEKVCALLKSSYWAAERPKASIIKSIEHSICISVFEGEEQVGFARVVTDYTLFAWIADVIVDPNHRGKGLGKAIMKCIQEHPDIPDKLQLLLTADAHGLYETFGFKNEECMTKR